MKFEFDPESHIGKADGKEWPSVTQLLTAFSLVDYSRVPEERLEYKKTLGSAVDMACDLWDRDNLDETSLHKDLLPYFNAYRKFREISGVEVDLERSMTRLWSKKWKVHGQPDLIGTLEGKLILIDRKCTWALYPAGNIQTAGYKLLFEEVHKEKIKERYLLKLNPNGNYDFVQCLDVTDQNIFLACVVLWWWKKNNNV